MKIFTANKCLFENYINMIHITIYINEILLYGQILHRNYEISINKIVLLMNIYQEEQVYQKLSLIKICDELYVNCVE